MLLLQIEKIRGAVEYKGGGALAATININSNRDKKLLSIDLKNDGLASYLPFSCDSLIPLFVYML